MLQRDPGAALAYAFSEVTQRVSPGRSSGFASHARLHRLERGGHLGSEGETSSERQELRARRLGDEPRGARRRGA